MALRRHSTQTAAATGRSNVLIERQMGNNQQPAIGWDGGGRLVARCIDGLLWMNWKCFAKCATGRGSMYERAWLPEHTLFPSGIWPQHSPTVTRLSVSTTVIILNGNSNDFSNCALSDGFINNHWLQQTSFPLLFSVAMLLLNFFFFCEDATCLYNGQKCANTFSCWHYGFKYVYHPQTNVGLLDFTPRQGLMTFLFSQSCGSTFSTFRVPTIEKQFICSSIAKYSYLFSLVPDVNCVGILH